MSIIGAIVAGLVGAAMMILVLATGPQMGMPRNDIVVLLGSTFSRNGPRSLGLLYHGVICVFSALIYAVIWSAGIGTIDLSTGALFGAVQWILVGAILGALPFVHAGVRSGVAKAPGIYMRNIAGSAGFFAGLAAHVIFGLSVALIYGIFQQK